LGQKNQEFEFYMNGSLLVSVDQERDIGEIVENLPYNVLKQQRKQWLCYCKIPESKGIDIHS